MLGKVIASGTKQSKYELKIPSQGLFWWVSVYSLQAWVFQKIFNLKGSVQPIETIASFRRKVIPLGVHILPTAFWPLLIIWSSELLFCELTSSYLLVKKRKRLLFFQVYRLSYQSVWLSCAFCDSVLQQVGYWVVMEMYICTPRLRDKPKTSTHNHTNRSELKFQRALSLNMRDSHQTRDVGGQYMQPEERLMLRQNVFFLSENNLYYHPTYTGEVF